MRYYISDLHFFNNRLNHTFDNRGFKNANEMNKYMINQWNGRVRKNDEVVIVGDFSDEKWEKTYEILKKLNGKKFLIIGNHDKFIKDKNFDPHSFEWIKDYAELNDNKRKVILCHYPLLSYNRQFSLDDNGTPKTYMLHGHTHHSTEQELLQGFQQIIKRTKNKDKVYIPCNLINCFCVDSDYVPLTLDEWINKNTK